jgi:hypothetical protein
METSQNEAMDQSSSVMTLARALQTATDGDIEVLLQYEQEQLDYADGQVEDARLERELVNMRLTMVEYEKVRRALYAANNASR